MFGVDHDTNRGRSGRGERGCTTTEAVQSTVAKGGGGKEVCPPRSIMHAAYVGAFDIVKSMVEVRFSVVRLIHSNRRSHGLNLVTQGLYIFIIMADVMIQLPKPSTNYL